MPRLSPTLVLALSLTAACSKPGPEPAGAAPIAETGTATDSPADTTAGMNPAEVVVDSVALADSVALTPADSTPVDTTVVPDSSTAN